MPSSLGHGETSSVAVRLRALGSGSERGSGMAMSSLVDGSTATWQSRRFYTFVCWEFILESCFGDFLQSCVLFQALRLRLHMWRWTQPLPIVRLSVSVTQPLDRKIALAT